MRIARHRPILPRSVAVAVIAGCAALLAGCSTHPVPPISAAAVSALRDFKEYTVYWAGMEVDGARLTDADSPLYFYSPVGFTMYYGDCEGRGLLRDGGCTLPLTITTSVYSAHSDASFGPQEWVSFHGVPAVVYDGGHDIEIYTDRMDVDIVADTPSRALHAAEALYPFNRTASVYFPAFPTPAYTPNPSQAQLDGLAPGSGPSGPGEASGPSGSTGATGATSDLAPPPQLEPAPQ